MANNHTSLATKYRPRTFEEMSGQETIKHILQYQLDTKTYKQCYLFAGKWGCGKALPLDSNILGPDGYFKMKDAKVGMKVWGEDGELHNIVGVFPQGVKEMYRIHFSDNTYTDCCIDHLWTMRSQQCSITNGPHQWFTQSVRWLLQQDLWTSYREDDKGHKNNNRKFRIPVVTALNIPEKELPVNPYLLGQFIADGSISSKNNDSLDITISDDDVRVKVNNLLNLIGLELAQISSVTDDNRFDYYIRNKDNSNSLRNLKQHLNDLNVRKKSIDKHIPKEYLFSSVDQRIQLLQGLFDGDGSVQSGCYTYSTSSHQLYEDIKFLIQSLGGTVNVTTGKPSFRKLEDGSRKYYGDNWEFSFHMPRDIKPFSSQKHSERYGKGSLYQNLAEVHKFIDHIEKIPDCECQCIMTDNPTGLFLTNDCIVTHNTTSARIFARTVNNGNHDIIEIDAATYNSVDQIRVISEEAKKMPLVGKYKIFIIDECFSGNSKVATPNGYFAIKDLNAGDAVYNLTGIGNIDTVHKVSVPVTRLCKVTVNGNDIYTTQDHLFFTTEGWIAAKDLHKGDVIIDYASLRNMWKTLSGELSERLSKNLFRSLQNSVKDSEYSQNFSFDSENMPELWKSLSDSEKRECYNVLQAVWLCIFSKNEQRDSQLCDMWKQFSVSYKQSEADLQSQLRFQVSSASQQSQTSSSDVCQAVCDLWQELYGELSKQTKSDLFKFVQKCIDFAKSARSSTTRKSASIHEDEQSVFSTGSNSESDGNEGISRYIAYMDRPTWWQWALYQSAISTVQRTWKQRRVGVSNSNKDSEGSWISYELQGGPRLSRLEDSDRGGWEFPFFEIPAVVRCLEDKFIGKFRVDSVEIYESANRSEFIAGGFDNSEIDSGYVTMYDLSVSGHPSYFVNNCLVHNCHSLSQSANNALLKILEEPPKTAMFILCTTDPQKMLNTVLSRVQRYDFTSIPTDEVISRLRYIADAESIDIDDASIRYIAKISGGSMRDSISNLDKCASVSEHITLNEVTNALAVSSYHDYLDLLISLIRKDSKSACKIIVDTYEAGKDMKKFISSFMWSVCDVCNSYVFNSFDYVNIPELPEYVNKIKTVTLEECLPILEWAKTLNAQIRNETDPKNVILVEVMLLTQAK